MALIRFGLAGPTYIWSVCLDDSFGSQASLSGQVDVGPRVEVGDMIGHSSGAEEADVHDEGDALRRWRLGSKLL